MGLPYVVTTDPLLGPGNYMHGPSSKKPKKAKVISCHETAAEALSEVLALRRGWWLQNRRSAAVALLDELIQASTDWSTGATSDEGRRYFESLGERASDAKSMIESGDRAATLLLELRRIVGRVDELARDVSRISKDIGNLPLL